MFIYRIDEWLDKIRNEFIPCNKIIKMLFGYIKFEQTTYNVYEQRLHAILKKLDTYLLDNSFLVGY